MNQTDRICVLETLIAVQDAQLEAIVRARAQHPFDLGGLSLAYEVAFDLSSLAAELSDLIEGRIDRPELMDACRALMGAADAFVERHPQTDRLAVATRLVREAVCAVIDDADERAAETRLASVIDRLGHASDGR